MTFNIKICKFWEHNLASLLPPSVTESSPNSIILGLDYNTIILDLGLFSKLVTYIIKMYLLTLHQGE